MNDEIPFETIHGAKVGTRQTYEYLEYRENLNEWDKKRLDADVNNTEFNEPKPVSPNNSFYDINSTLYSFDINCPECGVENNVQWDHYNDYETFLDDESGAGEYAIHECDECGYEIPFKINVNLWVEYSLESVELDTAQIKKDMKEKSS